MCGIFGIYGHPEAANLTYLGLHALQHRGQESAGISAADGERLRTHRGMGLVVDVFGEAELARLPGRAAVGHVRYSTAGDSDLANAQPLAVSYRHGQVAIAHNGNLVNGVPLRRDLERRGSIFTSTSDTEAIIHLLARSDRPTFEQRALGALDELSGAYALLVLAEDRLVAARDPHGFRPLSLGRITAPGGRTAWVFSSESCAFDLMGAERVRALEPGEVVVAGPDGLEVHQRPAAATPRFCVFEHVYFARPDSYLGPRSVYRSRLALGQRLADEQPADGDVVIPVPDSGNAAALGYARRSGIPFEMGLVRSHYVGRTFIEPRQSIRNFGVRLKLGPVREVIEGRRVVVVDDSLVRGTTSRKIVTMLRGAGAREVHLRISAPPTTHSCFYGIDTPTRAELIAATRGRDAIRDFVGCDSLGYLSLTGMLEALGAAPGRRYCDACFSGAYPVPVEQAQAAADARGRR